MRASSACAVVDAHERLHAAHAGIDEVAGDVARPVGGDAPVGVDHADDHAVAIRAGKQISEQVIGGVERLGLADARIRLVTPQHVQIRMVVAREDLGRRVVGAVVDDDDLAAGERHAEQPRDAVADRDLLVQRGHEEDPRERVLCAGPRARRRLLQRASRVRSARASRASWR